MKKHIKLIVVILCLSVPVFVQAQEIVAGYSLGYGKYLLNDLKTLQEKKVELVQEAFKEYKSVETFPEGFFHDAYLGVKFSFHEIGLKYDYLTSGGRDHLADYSGEIKDDNLVSGNALGLYYKIHFLSLPLNKQFRLTAHAGIATGAIYNKIDNKRLFTLHNPQQSPYYIYYNEYGYPEYIEIIADRSINEFKGIDETVKYRSTNWYMQPNIGIQLGFKNTLFLNLSAGYLFDNQGKLQTAGKNTIEIVGYYSDYGRYYPYEMTSPGKEYDLGIDWTGLRLSVGIGFAFSIK
jgi:hypothetical protein